jgi:hypothetical protein
MGADPTNAPLVVAEVEDAVVGGGGGGGCNAGEILLLEGGLAIGAAAAAAAAAAATLLVREFVGRCRCCCCCWTPWYLSRVTDEARSEEEFDEVPELSVSSAVMLLDVVWYESSRVDRRSTNLL